MKIKVTGISESTVPKNDTQDNLLLLKSREFSFIFMTRIISLKITRIFLSQEFPRHPDIPVIAEQVKQPLWMIYQF